MKYWLWSVNPAHFSAFVRTGTFAVRTRGRKALRQIVPGDRIFAYLSGSRVLAGDVVDERTMGRDRLSEEERGELVREARRSMERMIAVVEG